MIILINNIDFAALSGLLYTSGSNISNRITVLSGYDENTYVHRYNNESITGLKTFINQVKVQGTGVFGARQSISQDPSFDNIYVGVEFNNSELINTGAYIAFPDQGGLCWHDGASIRDWSTHSANGGELIIQGAPNMTLAGGVGVTSNPGSVQLGVSGPTHERWYLQYDDDPGSGKILGWSKSLSFVCRSFSGAQNLYANPGIMGWANTTGYAGNNADRAGDADNGGELRFYSETPYWHTITNTHILPDGFTGLQIGACSISGWRLNSLKVGSMTDIYGLINASGIIISGKAPSSPTSPGYSGQIGVSGSTLYICTGISKWGYINITPW